MENERRYAIKSVKTLEEAYHKYDGERISHIKVNYALMLSNLAVAVSFLVFGTDNPALSVASVGNLALVISNTWMLADACEKMEKTQNSLNEAYDDLNVPEEERIIDDEGRSK